MCIGQDVHGNIKLSLKATLCRPGRLETNDVIEGSVTSVKETANIWTPVGNASTAQEQNSASELSLGDLESGEAKSPTSQVPVILIRSAAECDEEEKSSSSNLSSKGNGVQLDSKSKSRQSQNAIDSPPISKSRRSQDVIDSPASHSGPLPYTNAKKTKLSMQKQKQSKSDLLKQEGDEQEAKDKASGIAKDLELGTKVTAKVYQIRAHGLVLDLGSGLRGMYRFEVGVHLCIVFSFLMISC